MRGRGVDTYPTELRDYVTLLSRRRPERLRFECIDEKAAGAAARALRHVPLLMADSDDPKERDAGRRFRQLWQLKADGCAVILGPRVEHHAFAPIIDEYRRLLADTPASTK